MSETSRLPGYRREERLRELNHEEGLTPSEIADKYNVGESTVRNQMRKFEVENRAPVKRWDKVDARSIMNGVEAPPGAETLDPTVCPDCGAKHGSRGEVAECMRGHAIEIAEEVDWP